MVNITRDIVINKALEYVETPYKHQGRKKGIGVDCVGLIIGVATELNIFDLNNDNTSYRMIPDGNLLMKKARENLVEKNINDLENGDVLVMTFDLYPQHFAFYYKKNNEEFIIHSYSKIKKVLVQRYDQSWKDKTQFAFSFKELI